MKGDFFTNLPEEMTRDIMERVPIRSIITCKCVCKPWRRWIEGVEFATLNALKPGLAFVNRDMGYTVCDEACRPLFRFCIPPLPLDHYLSTPLMCDVIGSTNGLLLAWEVYKNNYFILFVCNPMTGEYVMLPPLPSLRQSRNIYKCNWIFGFGESRLSRQYKILFIDDDDSRSCYVYTLGREASWRSIGGSPIIRWRSIWFVLRNVEAKHSPRLRCGANYALVFNGNLHWLASDVEKNGLICCFDLETEVFTSFPLPPGPSSAIRGCHLSILDGRLCLCDDSNDCIVLWWMNNYGDENSWTKKYTFRKQRPNTYGLSFLLKVLGNGDLLFSVDDQLSYNQLFIYFKETRKVKPYDPVQLATYYDSNIVTYTPSFLSLKSTGIREESIIKFLLNKTEL